MSTFAVYCDVIDFLQNNAANIETASLVGGNTTLSATAALGATSLSVTSVTGFPATGTFRAWILDGYTSETVLASVSGSTLSVPAGTLAAHAAGVNVASAGSTNAGCLADVIARCSREIDTFCQQGPTGTLERTLYQLQRTETYFAPSQRVYTSVDGTLVIRPWHFPVSATSTVTIQLGPTAPVSVDLTQYVRPNGGHTIEIPSASPGSSTSKVAAWTLITPLYLRDTDTWLNLTYTAGPIPALTLPIANDDIRDALFFLIQDRVGYRQNPTGAAMVHRGDVNFEARLRGDKTGKSLLKIEAERLLEPYRFLGRG